jgi:hypothetical protein
LTPLAVGLPEEDKGEEGEKEGEVEHKVRLAVDMPGIFFQEQIEIKFAR